MSTCRAWSYLVAAILVSGASAAASAATVSVTDTTFDQVTYVQSNAGRPYGYGVSSVTINASTVSGNVDQLTPDTNAIKASFSWSATATTNAGLGILDNAIVYNPSSQGAIDSLVLSANKTLVNGNTSPVRFLLQQDGNYYVYTTPNAVVNSGQYTNYTSKGLTTADFLQICLVNCANGTYGSVNGGSGPNFSSSGDALTFGFLATSSSGSSAPSNTTVFFDNFSLNVAQVGAVPEPSTWAMMIFGFAGVSCIAYRRRQKNVQMLEA